MTDCLAYTLALKIIATKIKFSQLSYSRKILLLFGTVNLTGNLLCFDNCKLMYLSLASFQGYFIMIVNCCFHVFGATVADLDAVSVKDLVEVMVSRKMLIK